MSLKKIIYIGTDKWAEQLENICNLKNISVIHSFIPNNSKDLLKICHAYEIPYTKTKNINNNLIKIKELVFDLYLVMGHPFLMSKELLQINEGIGFHPSLLPKRRGRAPLNWAIIDELNESGVSLFK